MPQWNGYDSANLTRGGMPITFWIASNAISVSPKRINLGHHHALRHINPAPAMSPIRLLHISGVTGNAERADSDERRNDRAIAESSVCFLLFCHNGDASHFQGIAKSFVRRAIFLCHRATLFSFPQARHGRCVTSNRRQGSDVKHPALRSPRDKVGGLVYFGRMIDKIRLHLGEELPDDYRENFGSNAALDGVLARFLNLEHSEIVERTAEGGSDEEFWNGVSCTAIGLTRCRCASGTPLRRSWVGAIPPRAPSHG